MDPSFHNVGVKRGQSMATLFILVLYIKLNILFRKITSTRHTKMVGRNNFSVLNVIFRWILTPFLVFFGWVFEPLFPAIREEGEDGAVCVGAHQQQPPPINLPDMHMLYGDEGFDEGSSEPENWEDELEFIGGRLVFHPGLNRYIFLSWNITLENEDGYSSS